MELVDGLDVGEHLGQGVLREEVLRAVLLVHPEVKHLQRQSNVYQIHIAM